MATLQRIEDARVSPETCRSSAARLQTAIRRAQCSDGVGEIVTGMHSHRRLTGSSTSKASRRRWCTASSMGQYTSPLGHVGQISTSARRCGTPSTDRVRGRSRRYGGRQINVGMITVDDREDHWTRLSALSFRIGSTTRRAVPPARARHARRSRARSRSRRRVSPDSVDTSATAEGDLERR